MKIASVGTWRPSSDIVPFLVACIGLCALYAATARDLFSGSWSTTRNAHGPIVFVVGLWYLYIKARTLTAGDVRGGAPLSGLAVLSCGLAVFVFGRSQAFPFFEVGSFVVVLFALVLLFFGGRVVRRLGFGFVFLMFMVPLPPSFVDILTLPLKTGVSYCAEHFLYWLGYPISRSGVILYVGRYQLLVADACSGLNSLFTLEAMGLLYLNLVRHESVLRNAVLAFLIVPISFLSNTTRVIVLSLITYHYGDDAGQGFLHGFAGIVLFLTALLMIVSVDAGLRWVAASMARGGVVDHRSAASGVPR